MRIVLTIQLTQLRTPAILPGMNRWGRVVMTVLAGAIAGILLSAAVARADTVWSLNDVSLLFPIDRPDALTELLRFDSSGDLGVLLPKEIYALFPQLLPQDQNQTFGEMRLVAARIDPCFPADATSQAACLKQIRFVWQPVVVRDGANTTLDASVHTFHLLSDDEFARLLTDLKLAKAQAGLAEGRASEPLQVHPVVQGQGLGGNYYRSLKTAFLAYAGERNLKRATFMTNHMMNNVWDFGGVDIDGGSVKPIVISRVNGKLQRFVNAASHFPQPTFFTGQIMPAMTAERDNLALIASNSRAIRPIEDEPKIEEAAAAALRIQNPRLHNPNTMDCVSCHVAQTAFRFANRQFAWLTLAERFRGETFVSQTFSNTNSTADPNRTDNLRALGYFERMPSISQRVINESSLVAEALNRLPAR